MIQVKVSPRGCVLVPAVVVEPLLVGSGESLPACLAVLLSSSMVFVVGGDVADRFVQSDRVVLDADAVEFGLEHDGIADVVVEVRPLALIASAAASSSAPS